MYEGFPFRRPPHGEVLRVAREREVLVQCFGKIAGEVVEEERGTDFRAGLDALLAAEREKRLLWVALLVRGEFPEVRPLRQGTRMGEAPGQFRCGALEKADHGRDVFPVVAGMGCEWLEFARYAPGRDARQSGVDGLRRKEAEGDFK